MSFTPLGNRVLIEREEQTNQTASGLYIPDSAKEKPLEGKVIAVGKEAVEAGVNEGDTVVFPKYGGTELTLDGKEYLIMSSDDILGVRA
ncbi:MAG: Heat shock protein 60 family co-chaperone GroES [uncultured Sulfurovum sp.]|uniref:Co-chaperonin GroES n=1 Tax=uncultured Sulfurovum sp. TaxID=269237 RepID=A0A6S6SSD4_9BACT|nr:MAG: Heat shock protein 60 family co-chaperone GroES [uncultured Sulfurovum sp.]